MSSSNSSVVSHSSGGGAAFSLRAAAVFDGSSILNMMTGSTVGGAGINSTADGGSGSGSLNNADGIVGVSGASAGGSGTNGATGGSGSNPFTDLSSGASAVLNNPFAGDGNADAQHEKKVMMVFVVGGISFLEIAAFRYLSKDPAFPFKIIIGTTKVLNGSSFLSSMEHLITA